jgi:hypothetical protein
MPLKIRIYFSVFCHFNTFVSSEVEKSKFVGVTMVVSKLVVGISEIGVKNEHEFVSIFRCGWSNGQLSELILEVAEHVFVGGTVYELCRRHEQTNTLFKGIIKMK